MSIQMNLQELKPWADSQKPNAQPELDTRLSPAERKDIGSFTGKDTGWPTEACDEFSECLPA